MNTVDSLLAPIFREIKQLESSINSKDKRILVSLYKQVNSGVFLTENQANLLVKILKENLPIVSSLIPDVEITIQSNTWSRNFREIRKIRKIYLSADFPNCFLVEFNFNSKLKEKISQLNSVIQGILPVTSLKYAISLTEVNLYETLNTFSKDKFEIDAQLLVFFEEIQNIQKTVVNPFEILSTTHEKLKNSVFEDVGLIDTSNALMLHDRKIRYQYEISEKIEENTLASKIATRNNRKIFITRNYLTIIPHIRLTQFDRYLFPN
jgi:hypothetical protein